MPLSQSSLTATKIVSRILMVNVLARKNAIRVIMFLVKDAVITM